MPSDSSQQSEPIPSSLIEDVCAQLNENKRVLRELPGGGMLRLDRTLPFLFVYRRHPERSDEGTSRLITSEAAYLCAPGAAAERKGLKRLVRRVCETICQQLGSCLLLEIWSSDDRIEIDHSTGELLLPRPSFRIMTRRPHRPEGTVATLEFALQQVRVHRQSATVEINMHADNHPPGMAPLISPQLESRLGCHVLGLEVRPIYRDPASAEVYVRVLQSLSRQVSHALKKACFSFALNRTNERPEHYFSLRSSKLTKQVYAVDRQLAELSGKFKFLLLVTPINAERAWINFSSGGFRKAPVFQYRPLDADPLLLKRRLMRVATERVDDPTLAFVFRQTQLELDRQISMLADIGTFRFLPGSVQVFGNVKASLRKLADGILKSLPARDPTLQSKATLGAKGFLQLAEKEIDYYQKQSPSFVARAATRDDTFSGLLVAGGELLIGRQTRIAKTRAAALLQHEVGTHLLTYYNGAAQPLRLLQVGLANYDALQEGLAVLSEHLVGGLSAARLRTLAARVVAVDEVIRGCSFPDVFQHLVDGFGFEPRTAYTIALRVFRGGGLTKDALYLRGLVDVLRYVADGGDLETLMLGKFAVEHVPIVRELRIAGVLRSPPLRPRYLDSADAQQRLQRITSTTSPLDLID